MDAIVSERFDCIVTGGGLVGATLAIGLAKRGFSTALIETHPLRAGDQPSYDDRTLALSHASCGILRDTGLWPTADEGATPIREVHISARGRLGTARINAHEMGVDALGHVVEARLIGQEVRRALPACAGLSFLNPARVTGFEDQGREVIVTVTDEEHGERNIAAGLLIGADGAASVIRERLGLPVVRRDYGQTAVIANVTPERAHEGRAFERFTDTGPVALLPHQGRRCGAVWATTHEHAETLLTQDDDTFLAGLQARAGYRLGTLQRIGRRSAYPLHLCYAPNAVRGRCAVIGNAAHTIHPVAAQGFNLGLRDIAAMLALLVEARERRRGIDEALVAYQTARQQDQRRMVAFTDFLIDAFAVDLPVLRHLPGLGIMALDRLPFLKRALARRTMGYGAAAVKLP